MPSERTVHIVVDDPAVRRSLERLLLAAGLATVAYESASAFLDALGPERMPECLLLDLGMPGMDGLELLARLNELGVWLPVIIMTGHGDVQTAVQAMKAGAIDFIEKPFDEQRLLTPIESAFARVGLATQNREMMDAAERIATLSPREREVLNRLVAGQPNKVIAFDLGLSVRTVEVHRARMLDRLSTSCLADAIKLAVLAGLTPSFTRNDNAGPNAKRGPLSASPVSAHIVS